MTGHQLVVVKAEKEIEHLRLKSGNNGRNTLNTDKLKTELQEIAGEALDHATFAERLILSPN